jgi:hypothetical protein
MPLSFPSPQRNLENGAVYLRTHLDKPRAWGQIVTPPGTLHSKDIEVGLRLNPPEGRQLYLDMKDDARFHNPTPHRIGCYELTEAGKDWADRLIRKASRARDEE